MFTKQILTLKAYMANLQPEEGQGLAEYALIIVLVAIVVVIALTAVGTQISTIFDNIVDELGG